MGFIRHTMKLITYLSLCFSVLTLVGQNTVADSLKKVIEEADDPNVKIIALSKLNDQFQNPNDKLVYSRQAFQLIANASTKNKILAANEMGISHGMLGQIDSSEYYFNIALEASLESKDSAFISSAYNGLGNLARLSGSLDKSLGHFLNALNYADGVGKKEWNADIMTNISGVYYDLNNYDAALQKVLEARAIYEQLDDASNISYTANLLAIVYRALGEYDLAYTYNQEALGMLLIIKDTMQIIYNLVSTTEILMEQNQLDKAAKNALQTINLASEYGELDPHITSLSTLAIIFYQQGKLRKAEKYINQALELANAYGFANQLPNAYMVKSFIESARGNPESAVEWMELRIALNDSIRSKETSDKISELNVQYETAKKESEIERLSAQQEINDLELKQARTRNFFLTLLALFFVSVGLFIFYLYRQRMKMNRQLKAVNATKDRLFSVIAHDIKNPLSAFKSIAQALEENYQSMPEDQLNQFIKQLDTSSSKLLELLQNLLEWSISETGSLRYHPESLDLKAVAADAIDLFQGAIDAKHLQTENNIAPDTIAFADHKMVFSIIRNLISNAVKFTPNNGTISIEANSNDSYISVAVKDNGPGMTPEQADKLFTKEASTHKSGTGLGLVICKEFVEMHGGTIRIESKEGGGATFVFTLKREAK